MINKIVDKLLSGRFLLTLLCGITFSYLSCTGKISPEKVVEIFKLVVIAYFAMGAITKNGGTK